MRLAAAIVFAKELRDAMRDRRTALAVFIASILTGPLTLALVGQACPHAPQWIGLVFGRNPKDATQFFRLLRARGKRPRGRGTSEKRDEIASSHGASGNARSQYPNVALCERVVRQKRL